MDLAFLWVLEYDILYLLFVAGNTINNRKGFVSGIIIGAYGLGAFTFSFLSFAIANPNNAVPELEVEGGAIFSQDQPESDNAPRMLRVCVLFWMVLSFIGVSFVKQRSKTQEELLSKRNHEENVVNDEVNPTQKLIELEHLTTHEYPAFSDAIRQRKSIYIWLMSFFGWCYTMFMANVFKSYGEKYIKDDAFITTIGAVGAILNGLGRTIWATLMDKYGFKKVYGALLIVKISVAMTIPFARMSSLLYFIWISLTFVTLGGQFSLFPALCGKIYGAKTGGLVFSVLYSGSMMSVILGLIFTRLLLAPLGYNFIIILTAFMAMVSLGILCIFDESIVLNKSLRKKGVIIKHPVL
jgi:MFS family permease